MCAYLKNTHVLGLGHTDRGSARAGALRQLEERL
jgi:hypothetical protein